MMAAGGLTEDQLESAVLKTMGRCFLAPDDQQPDNETEIWISIGESKTGLRMYPHYLPHCICERVILGLRAHARQQRMVVGVQR